MISKNVEPIFHTSFLGLIFNHELLPTPLVILHLEYTPISQNTLPHICWSSVLCFKLRERDRSLYTKQGEGGEKIGFSWYCNVVNTFTQSDQGKPKKQSQADPSWDLHHLFFIHSYAGGHDPISGCWITKEGEESFHI